MQYRIKATKNQLDSIGISRYISGFIVNEIVKKYKTGYVKISIPPEDQMVKLLGGEKFKNEEYDIPECFLEKIK